MRAVYNKKNKTIQVTINALDWVELPSFGDVDTQTMSALEAMQLERLLNALDKPEGLS